MPAVPPTGIRSTNRTVTINASGVIELRGSTLTLDEEVGTSLLDLNLGGSLIGNGTISFADNPGVATSMLSNDGTLTVLSRGLAVFSPPPVGAVTISDVGLNGRLDLDGSGEAGVVNINRNQSLVTEMPLSDVFNGTLNLFHNSTLQFAPVFTLGTGGLIVVDNGFVDGALPNPDIPADTAFIEAAGLTQTGGTINVVDTDGTLQLNAPFTMSGGSFTNAGTVIFNGVTSITTAAGYDPSDIDSQTIVNASVTINDAAGNFDWAATARPTRTSTPRARSRLQLHRSTQPTMSSAARSTWSAAATGSSLTSLTSMATRRSTRRSRSIVRGSSPTSMPA